MVICNVDRPPTKLRKVRLAVTARNAQIGARLYHFPFAAFLPFHSCIILGAHEAEGIAVLPSFYYYFGASWLSSRTVRPLRRHHPPIDDGIRSRRIFTDSGQMQKTKTSACSLCHTNHVLTCACVLVIYIGSRRASQAQCASQRPDSSIVLSYFTQVTS